MSKFPSEQVLKSIHFFMDGCNGHCDADPSHDHETKTQTHFRGFPEQENIPQQLDLEQSHAKVHALWQGSTDLSIQKAQAAAKFIDTMTKLDSQFHHSDTQTQDHGSHPQLGTNLSIQTTQDAAKFIDSMVKLDGGEQIVNREARQGDQATFDQLPNLSLQKTHDASKFIDVMSKLDSPVHRSRRSDSPAQRLRKNSIGRGSPSLQPTNLSIQKAHDATKFIDNMIRIDNGEHTSHHGTQKSTEQSQQSTNLSLQKAQDVTRFLDRMQRINI
jgi:hypothetical protein